MTIPSSFFGSTRYHIIRGTAFVVLALVFLAIILFTGRAVPWFAYAALLVMAVAGGVHLFLAYSGRKKRVSARSHHAPAVHDEHNGGATMTQWWYNHKTGEVEEGPQSLGSERDGPFATREEAARAPQIIAERARKWAEDDAARD